MVDYHPAHYPQGMAAQLQATPSKFLVQLLQLWWTKRSVSHDTVSFMVGECTHPQYRPHGFQTSCLQHSLGAGAGCQSCLIPCNFPPDLSPPFAITLCPTFIYIFSCALLFSSLVYVVAQLYLFILDVFISSRMQVSHCWCLEKMCDSRHW